MTQENTKLMLGVYDCIFKAIMLDPNNRDYLKEIIHYVTDIPLSDLENIKIKNTEHLISNKKNKKLRSDIIVDIKRLSINIEMNKDYYDGIYQKNDAYLQSIASSMYKESEDYLEIKNIIQINFDNFSYFKNNQEIYKFTYKDSKSNVELPENPIKYYIDLEYIYNTCYNKPVVNLSKFERYCLLLRAETKEFADNIAGDDIVMKKVSEKLNELNSDEIMIGLYDAEKEDEKIRKTQLKGAKNEGIEERNIEIAKSMLRDDVDVKLISKYTGLTVNQIKNIKNEI